MNKLSAAVGRGAPNRMHDVVVVQVALSKIAVKSGGRPLWSGRVDGRFGPELGAAIGAFQRSRNLTVTERVDPDDTTRRAFDSVLPSAMKGMTALADTTCLFVGEGGSQATGLKGVALPRTLADPAARVVGDLEKNHGLGVELGRPALGDDGRLSVPVRARVRHWLDNQGRPVPGNGPPREAREALRKVLGAVTAFEAGGGENLELRTRYPLTSALAVRQTQANDRARAFYELEKPKSDLAERCLVCACNLLEHPEKLDGEKKKSLAALTEILQGDQPALGKALGDRAKLLTGPPSVDRFKYLRHPTEADIRAAAGPPTLFFLDGDRVPATINDTHVPGLNVPPYDRARAEMVTLPIGVERAAGASVRTEIRAEVPLIDRLVRCALRHYGFDIWIAYYAVKSGQPIFDKPRTGLGGGSAAGGTDKTSIASIKARKFFGDTKLPFSILTVAGKNFPKVIRLGTIVGRSVPFVGWALLAFDLAVIINCGAGRGARRTMFEDDVLF